MVDMEVLATGLRFPEGPVSLADGSIALVEIARGTVSRVTPDGEVTVIADLGGGPNGHPLPARSTMVMGHSRDVRFDGLAPLKPQREGELGGQVV